MSISDLCFLPIHRLASLIAAGEVSPVELVQAHLERIDRLDDRLGAYITVLRAESMEAARFAEREIASGLYRGPLHGIPVSLKDIFYIRGVRTTAASLALADFVPEYDGTVTARLKEAGAIVIGKANLFEFALGPKTPYHYGVTRNPWGLDRITGSSSSGSAVGVAAGLCTASLGTDTGGSIRLPAAFCGTVGLKPTYGRVSRYGILPGAWSLDSAGPLTRSVADAALVLNAIAGYDPNDPASAELPAPDYHAALGGDLEGIRIGVPSNFFFEYLDPEVESATRAAVDLLQGLGGELVEVAIPAVNHAQTASSVIMLAENAAAHETLMRARGSEYGENARTRVQVGSTLLATDYLKAQRVRTVVQRQFVRAMAGADVLVSPTIPRPAIRTTDRMPKNDGAEAARTANNRFTRPFSLLGWPAVSLPCGFSSEGMPISLQIVGKPFAEGLILKVAHAYEQATEWHQRRPPVD